MRPDTVLYRLVVYDFGGVQVVLGVESLKRLEILLIYDLGFNL